MSTVDNGLLFGLVALQHGLVDRGQLVNAFKEWCHSKSETIESILIEQGAIHADVRGTLNQMVKLLLQHHGDDWQKSFASIASSGVRGAMIDLFKLDDDDLAQSIGSLTTMELPSNVNPYPEGFQGQAAHRFRVLRPMPGGEGGMGIISVALDEELGREVAYKQIRSERDAHGGYREKFEIEAEVTGNLEHPGIVPVYGLGIGADGRPYYAMRLVRGDNLSIAIKAFHATPSAEEVDYDSLEFRGLVDRVIDVAQAISYAHSRGVLHRDLKPGNIMLGKFGETLVIDWGLARIPQTAPEVTKNDDKAQDLLEIRSGSRVDHTRHGSAMGTLGFSPPEQLTGIVASIGPRSDVYSLGAILYQVLTGETPVTTKDAHGNNRDPEDIKQDVVLGNVKAPRVYSKKTPNPLNAICLKALSTEPKNRYGSVTALIDDLNRWKADMPVEARSESLVEKTARYVRKHKAAAISAFVALALTSIIACVAAWYIDAAKRNETLAKNDAETLAARNQKVVDFFVVSFGTPNPSNSGASAEMGAIDVLRTAEASIAGSFEDDPLTKAALAEALGKSFFSLSDYVRARHLLKLAVDLRTQELGSDHRDVLKTSSALAQAIYWCGDVQGAVQMHEAITERMGEQLGDLDVDTLRGMLALSSAYFGGNNEELYNRACDMRKQVFSQLQEKLGRNHEHVLAAKTALAESYLQKFGVERALPMFEEIEQAVAQSLGSHHPRSIEATHNLAYCLNLVGRTRKAQALWNSQLEIAREKLGNSHAHTIELMHNLASSSFQSGDEQSAFELWAEAAELTEKWDEPSYNTIKLMNNFAAFILQKSKDRQPGIAILEKAVELGCEIRGENDLSTVYVSEGLAMLYILEYEYARTIPLYERAIKMRSQLPMANQNEECFRIAVNNLSHAFRMTGDLNAATDMLATELARIDAKSDKDPAVSFNILSRLMRLLQQQAKFSDIVALARQFEHEWRGDMEDQAANITRLQTSFATALAEIGDVESGLIEARAAVLRAETQNLTFRITAFANSTLGAILAKQEKAAEAEPLLVKASESLVTHIDDLRRQDRWMMNQCFQRVIDFFEARHDEENVKKWKISFAETKARFAEAINR